MNQQQRATDRVGEEEPKLSRQKLPDPRLVGYDFDKPYDGHKHNVLRKLGDEYG